MIAATPEPLGDPLIYPAATEITPFGSPVKVDGLRATPCGPDEANGEALTPSHAGDATHYLAGQTMRVRMLPA